MRPNLAKFIPHDAHAKTLKAKKSIIPHPNPRADVESGIFSVKLASNDTFYIYRRGKFIGAWVIGGFFSAIAGYENLDRCAALAVERWSSKILSGVVNA